MPSISPDSSALFDGVSYQLQTLCPEWMCCFLLVSDVMHSHSFYGVDIVEDLKAQILLGRIEAGAGLVDVGEVAVTEDLGIRVLGFQTAEQSQ